MYTKVFLDHGITLFKLDLLGERNKEILKVVDFELISMSNIIGNLEVLFLTIMKLPTRFLLSVRTCGVQNQYVGNLQIVCETVWLLAGRCFILCGDCGDRAGVGVGVGALCVIVCWGMWAWDPPQASPRPVFV